MWIIGATSGLIGTSRGQAHLRQILVGLNALAVNVPQVFIASSAQKFDAEGRLIDKNARDLIELLLAALAKHAGKLKG